MARPPLSYYKDLRLKDLDYETDDESRVIKVTTEDGERIRLLHISQFALVSAPRFSVFSESGVPIRRPAHALVTYWEAAAFMAAKHFNDRDESIVPGLAERLQGCDLHLTLDLLDSQLSPIVASRQLYEQLTTNHSLSTPVPGGIIGSFSSSTTQPLAILSGTYDTPHVGAISSADFFDQKDVYPFFARTNPSNEGHARAAVELLKYWKVTHVACIYGRLDYGVSFFTHFQREASRAGLQLVSAVYEVDNEQSIIRALKRIKATGFRYVMGIFTPARSDVILKAAVDMQLIGDDLQWIVTPFGDLASPRLQLPLEKIKYATALHGIASVEIEMPSSYAFFNQMRALSFDAELQDFFVSSHAEPFLYDGFKWNESFPVLTSFAYTGYDALMALGISACDTEQDFFTGREYLEQLKKIRFSGVSGPVAFDKKTGTRTVDGFKYVFTNILADFNSTQDGTGQISFKSRPSIEVDFSRSVPVRETTPFLFHSGETTKPESLPPLGAVDLNLIPRGIQIFGWVLAGVLMLLSTGFGLYTIKYRRQKLIRASQPIFLGMLCTGTFIMGTAIIPMGLQEPTEGLDAACISIPWLVAIGFSTAFSALFTKAWRINSLFRQSMAMNRLAVKAAHVIWPFTALTCANVIILTTWTVVSPLEYKRTYLDGKDKYGRPIESYGTCQWSDDNSPIFLTLLAVINFLAVVLANYQSYIGRKIPSDFNESFYIAISMASILECFLIGMPISVFVKESPSTDFVVKSLLLFCTSLAILLPLFVSKITARSSAHSLDVNAMHIAISQSRKSMTSSRGNSTSRENSKSRRNSSADSTMLPSSVAQLRASIAASSKHENSLPSSVDQLRASIMQKRTVA